MQVRVLPIIHKIDTTMKRIVKFRGKSKKTGEWLYGDLVRNVEGVFAVVPPFEMTTDNFCDRYEVDENTIGQFTGIYDANGKEIYDGDIVQDNGIVYKAVEYRESKSAFVMYIIGFEDMWYPLNHFVSVFGNIHDSFDWKHLDCTTL